MLHFDRKNKRLAGAYFFVLQHGFRVRFVEINSTKTLSSKYKRKIVLKLLSFESLKEFK